jgi:hypothetical protein
MKKKMKGKITIEKNKQKIFEGDNYTINIAGKEDIIEMDYPIGVSCIAVTPIYESTIVYTDKYIPEFYIIDILDERNKEDIVDLCNKLNDIIIEGREIKDECRSIT